MPEIAREKNTETCISRGECWEIPKPSTLVDSAPFPKNAQMQIKAALEILSMAEVEAMKCAQVARGPAPPPRTLGVSLALDELLARVKVMNNPRVQP
jgi:hypothetical protein